MLDSYTDDETSMLRSVLSGRCRCAQCQQRSHKMLTVRSSSVAVLPNDDDVWPSFLRTYIDQDALQYLNEKRVINWCRGAHTLYPRKTTGDGNCLLHAVSMFIWGYPDDSMYLRRVLHSNMSQYGCRTELRQRWQRQHEWQNTFIPDGGLQYTDEEWDREWQLLVSSADFKRQSPASSGQLPYDFLEQFHVFVLANILQRPIIIVGEPYLRSMTGDSIEPNDFVGIYLPLMWSPAICLQVPIVLAFLMNHFLPLSFRSHSSSGTSSNVYAVPLVTSSMEPLRVHFLLQNEENVAHVLLQQYLELIELEAAGFSGFDGVLAAKLVQDDLSYRRPHMLTVRNMFIQANYFWPKCTVDGCEFPGIDTMNGNCILCSMMSCPPYQSLVDSALQGSFDGVSSLQCTNVGCDNDSWLPMGGLCRLCSCGFYPSRYDMTFNAFISEFKKQHTKLGSGSKCSVSGCSMSSDIDFDSARLPGYNTLHAAHKTQLYCRTTKVNVCETKSVQKLCGLHAEVQPEEYWLNFLQKLEESGIKPSSQLTMKISAWLRLSMKAVHGLVLNTGDQCAQAGCGESTFGNTPFCWSCLHTRHSAQSQKCCTLGCRKISLTRSGFCLVCCNTDMIRRLRYSAIAGLTARQLDASDADSGPHWETVRNLNHQDQQRQDVDSCSIEPVSPVKRRPVKPRRSLLSSDQSLTSSNIASDQAVCIGPMCTDKGLDKYNGLCAACYTVLVKINRQQHRISTSYGATAQNVIKCRSDWCQHTVVHKELSLCDLCYQRIFS